MKTEKMITVRAYPVEIRDERTGEKTKDTIVLDKAMLQAGAMVGLGDEDIIFRLYNRKGYRVFEIGKPVKADLSVNLDDLYTAKLREDITDREVIQEGAGQEVGASDAE